MTFGMPERWGFIRDLRECVGKTIQEVELAKLGYGYTVNSAWAVKFTDGSRGFFIERPSKGTAITPSEDWMKTSRIFTPEELGEVVATHMREKQEAARRREEDEKRQFAELQKKYG
jgi:hypothetical protein